MRIVALAPAIVLVLVLVIVIDTHRSPLINAATAVVPKGLNEIAQGCVPATLGSLPPYSSSFPEGEQQSLFPRESRP